jgi:hypothetical protein
MRISVFIVCLVLLTLYATPAEAQLRQDAAVANAPVRLYDQGGPGFSLNRFFSPEHFRMSHSVELSSSSFGGYGGTLAMYTNSMMWQFSSKLAARVDLAMAYSPTSSYPGMSATGQGDTRVFLRNAELAFRPKENMLLHLSVRQSPYGMYASPYGWAGGYGPSYGYDAWDHGTRGDLFWNSRLR